MQLKNSTLKMVLFHRRCSTGLPRRPSFWFFWYSFLLLRKNKNSPVITCLSFHFLLRLHEPLSFVSSASAWYHRESLLVVRSPKLNPTRRGWNLDGRPLQNTSCCTLSFFLCLLLSSFYIYQWHFRSKLFHSDSFFVLVAKLTARRLFHYQHLGGKKKKT